MSAKMCKKFFMFEFTVLIFCSLCSASYAEFEIVALLYSNHEFELIYSTERFVVTQRTDFWRYMPYSQVNNELFSYMSVNFTLNIGPYYTDAYGNERYKHQYNELCSCS